MKDRIDQAISKMKTGAHIEYHETRVMLKLISKKDKTEDEKKFIKEQLADIFRMGVGGGITVLPLGSFLFVFVAKILKKTGDIELLPSGFEKDAKLHDMVKDVKTSP